jgi:hypothetical protein
MGIGSKLKAMLPNMGGKGGLSSALQKGKEALRGGMDIT